MCSVMIPLHTLGQDGEVTIRQLGFNDLPGLEWDGALIHYRNVYRDIYHSVGRQQAVMWGAVDPNNRIIGQVFIQLQSMDPALANGKNRAYLHGFRIRPAYRSAGLGTRIHTALVNDLCERQYDTLTLNCGKDNPGGIRFYKRLGYRIVADSPGKWYYTNHRGEKIDVHEPSWVMVLSLPREVQKGR